MRNLVVVAACVMLVAGLTGCPSTQKAAPTKALQLSVVDFEGLPAGTIVDELSSGAGVTGPLVGVIKVSSINDDGLNVACIFDSANPTNSDLDLGTPNELYGGPGIGVGGASNDTPYGNIMIITGNLRDLNNDGLVDFPNDDPFPDGPLTFDFSMVGTNGTVLVKDITFIDSGDTEGASTVQFSGPALPLTELEIPPVEDNGKVTLDVNLAGVSLMQVLFAGSGAVAEFQIEQEMEEDDGGFRTQTQGGWGTGCAGNNPGCYRDANFDSCFPNGLQVGCEPGYSLTFTSSNAIKNFLPSGGRPQALKKDAIDPTNGGNVLAGQIVALTLNVGFDLCDPDFGESNTALADLEVIDPESKCFGMTVQEVLDLANAILGGCSTALTPSQINECVSKINENFVDGETDNGFLG
jgi:hypothetical protein